MRKVVHVLSPVGIYYLGDSSATKIHNGLDDRPSSTGFFTSHLGIYPAGEGLGSVHQYSGYTSCLAQLIYDLINRQFLCVVSQTSDDSIVAAGINIPQAVCNRRFVIRQTNRPTME